jgi:hypothetical protein
MATRILPPHVEKRMDLVLAPDVADRLERDGA